MVLRYSLISIMSVQIRSTASALLDGLLTAVLRHAHLRVVKGLLSVSGTSAADLYEMFRAALFFSTSVATSAIFIRRASRCARLVRP